VFSCPQKEEEADAESISSVSISKSEVDEFGKLHTRKVPNMSAKSQLET